MGNGDLFLYFRVLLLHLLSLSPVLSSAEIRLMGEVGNCYVTVSLLTCGGGVR